MCLGPLKKGFFRLTTSRGEEFDIRKGTLGYLYQKRDDVSIDRLYRFRASTSTSNDEDGGNSPSIKVDDFVLMNSIHEVCHILHFKYLNRRRKKDSEFNFDKVNVSSNDLNEIGALCQFYKFKLSNNVLSLELSKNPPFFVPLEYYLCTLPKPKITENSHFLYETNSVTTYNLIRETLGE